MKQFNRIMTFVCVVWILVAGVAAILIYHFENTKYNKEYLVEINRIVDYVKNQRTFVEIDCNSYQYIKQVDYFPVSQDNQIIAGNTEAVDIITGNTEAVDIQWEEYTGLLSDFFNGKDVPAISVRSVPYQQEYRIIPLVIKSHLQGYLRFAYAVNHKKIQLQLIFIVETILCCGFLLLLYSFCYIRSSIIKPFHEISELPLELSKGHLMHGLKDTKNRYFGKFIWGLNLLRESLEERRNKELQLQKDKKLMILSLSHDIKTPLSTIKLYSKALYDNLYHTEEKKRDTARKIEEKADQIEAFVSEIVKTSSTDLFEFEIHMSEFYLYNLVEAVQRSYSEKFDLLKIDFFQDAYSDKLLLGDLDKLMDVFDNIIQNAVKYGDGKSIKVTYEEEDNYQLIRITNTGIPVQSAHLHHMFESFWRGDNAIGKQGNGLGLYICKQILHRMEGEIYAEAGENCMSFVIVIKIG